MTTLKAITFLPNASEEGLAFAPVVIDACGGAWGTSASKIFVELAISKSVRIGESKDVVQTQLFQNLGVILYHENAQVVSKKIYLAEIYSADLLHSFHSASLRVGTGHRVNFSRAGSA